MTFYECTTYKEALLHLVEERKTIKKAVTFESLADHCRIQKTYLSKVLNKEGNLSLDQVYLAAEYLKLSFSEQSYLENLYLLNTTRVQARQNKLQHLIDKAKKENLKSENSIKVENEITIQQQLTEKYYLDPYYQLIHIFLTIHNYAKNPFEIAQKLNLSQNKFEEYLNDLIDWKIIQFKNNQYNVLKNNLHLSKDSHLNSVFRNFARQSSLSKINQLESEDFYSFSAIISCDEETKSKIQKRFLDFLKNCQTDVGKSDSKDVFQINFDLLKWS